MMLDEFRKEIVPEPVSQKHSNLAIGAIVVSAPIWLYLVLIFLSWGILGPLLTMGNCNENDFGACALKKLFGPIISLIVLVILGIVPLIIYSASTIMSVIVYRRKNSRKELAVAALVNNGLSLVMGMLLMAALLIFG